MTTNINDFTETAVTDNPVIQETEMEAPSTENVVEDVSDVVEETQELSAETSTETSAETYTESIPQDVTPEATTETMAAAADTPSWDNFKYSVRDQEKEFEDWAKPYIKDEESYKKFQDLFTAKEGISLAKDERDTVQTKLNDLNESLATVGGHIRNGDVETFINTLGLDKKLFIDYAIKELKYAEMSHEERAQVDADKMQTQRFNQMEFQNQQMQQRLQEQETAHKKLELDGVLSAPNVQNLANEFDGRVGRHGAFRNAVIERGIYHHAINKVTLSAQDAVNDAISHLGLSVGTVDQSTNVHNVGTQPRTTVKQQKTKATIPNVQGRGTSPVGSKLPSSLDDLRRLHASRYGS